MTEPQRDRRSGPSQPSIAFRKYAPGDIPACARLAREAWPARPSILPKEDEDTGMEGYMEYSLSASNYADVACTPEGMVGFLFGRIDGHGEEIRVSGPDTGETKSKTRTSLRDWLFAIRHLRFLWSVLLTDLKLMLYMPRSDAAIEMFIVASEHRGKGVGTALLQRYLDAARGAGTKLVTVYTDDRMSDWRFYERNGFTRVKTFKDNITSHYSGSYARGIIYVLTLHRSP